ncbi:MAG: radical SAM protein [Candidatus Omnitrophota bacterium]
MNKNFSYIYGPVYSWRLGVSLGIDPIGQKRKYCNFNCVYCQLGKTPVLTGKRSVFVPARAVLDEVNALDPNLKLDYLTFSGRGEPTLANNLGEMIDLLKQHRREKIAVITNSGLMGNPGVRSDLLKADFVLAKLDACEEKSFETVDRPLPSQTLSSIVDGLKMFSKEFKGKLALQMMFIDLNKHCAPEMARIAEEIDPDEIELNTPLRPCAVRPLSSEEMLEIKSFFHRSTVMVYEREKKDVTAMDEKQTVRRHGKYLEENE